MNVCSKKQSGLIAVSECQPGGVWLPRTPDNCATKMLGKPCVCSLILRALEEKRGNWRVRPWCVLADSRLEWPVGQGDSRWFFKNGCITWRLDFLSGPWNGKKVLGTRSALYLYDIFPGCYAHLCSISYLFRSLHEGHVPSTAVWLPSSVFCRPVEWDERSGTATT